MVTSTNSACTSGPLRARRTATNGSLDAANSFFTCEPSGPIQAGAASPMMVRSIPIRWDSWSLTSQPGHSVGRAHSVEESSWQASAREPQVSARASPAARPNSSHPLPVTGSTLASSPLTAPSPAAQ